LFMKGCHLYDPNLRPFFSSTCFFGLSFHNTCFFSKRSLSLGPKTPRSMPTWKIRVKPKGSKGSRKVEILQVSGRADLSYIKMRIADEFDLSEYQDITVFLGKKQLRDTSKSLRSLGLSDGCLVTFECITPKPTQKRVTRKRKDTSKAPNAKRHKAVQWIDWDWSGDAEPYLAFMHNESNIYISSMCHESYPCQHQGTCDGQGRWWSGVDIYKMLLECGYSHPHFAAYAKM